MRCESVVKLGANVEKKGDLSENRTPQYFERF